MPTKEHGAEELRNLVLDTINRLLELACKRVVGYKVMPNDIVKATIAANSTMMHLLLGIPAASIRLSPFVTLGEPRSVDQCQRSGIEDQSGRNR